MDHRNVVIGALLLSLCMCLHYIGTNNTHKECVCNCPSSPAPKVLSMIDHAQRQQNEVRALTPLPQQQQLQQQSMFPTWSHFFKHYKWQVELKYHACRVEDPLVNVKVNCKYHNTTAPEEVLRKFYVDELQRRILLDSRKFARDRMIQKGFGDWPTAADSMGGHPRLENVRKLLLDAVNRSGLTGNFVETGVWRGGTSLYARFIQREFLNPDAHVYVCDSFAGLPEARTNTHKSDKHWKSLESFLAVPLPRVQQLFRDYGALDENHVHFRKGFFVDSMPPLREELIRENRKISVLRLDGDMYESTIDVLYHLYDLVEVGGWVIVDDWSWKRSAPVAYFGAQTAVFDFRYMHGIEDEAHAMIEIVGDQYGAYFRKAREITVKRHLYPNNTKPTKSFTKKDGLTLIRNWESLRSVVWNESGMW